MLITLGCIALILAVILIVAGYTVAPAALTPGWGVLILAVILLVLGYLLPVLTTPDDTYVGQAVTTLVG